MAQHLALVVVAIQLASTYFSTRLALSNAALLFASMSFAVSNARASVGAAEIVATLHGAAFLFASTMFVLLPNH
jgi:hypothetical protein